MTRLEAHALTGSRGPSTLFRDISFTVSPGQWVALRGANGSGKTTLLRCVAGHLAGLKDDLSAEENLRDSLALRGLRVTDEATQAALAEVGLASRRHLPARRLSAGQRRRIGLARLALDPAACWALDEPLTALDDEGQRHFQRLLANHLEGGGLALIATHQPLAPSPERELRMGA